MPMPDLPAPEARVRVVDAARKWIGTPYHHMADIHGVGVDCAMLLVRVFCGLGLVTPFDPRPYTRDWMLHRDDERYLGFLLASAREVDAPQPGDVIVFRVGRCYAHAGIVTKADPLTILHAFAPAARVLEEPLARNSQLAGRLAAARFFSHWGV
jgi:NlpC/P60 family putative phage cell wall peptidase